MHDATINDVRLSVDTFGDPGDPALLLIMGAAASMDRWEPPFCERLAAAAPARDPLRPPRHGCLDHLAPG